MTRPGFGRCPDCDTPVLFALAVTGDVLSFDAAFEDGPWAVAWDVTRTPRCRLAGRSRSVRDREYLYRQHAEACLAADGPIAAVAQFRRPSPLRRDPAPVPERRAANAR